MFQVAAFLCASKRLSRERTMKTMEFDTRQLLWFRGPLDWLYETNEYPIRDWVARRVYEETHTAANCGTFAQVATFKVLNAE